MTAADWIQTIGIIAVALGTGGIFLTPRLRRQIAAQTDQIQTERDVARTRLDLDIFKESLVEAHRRIESLSHRADSAEAKLAEKEVLHRAEVEGYRADLLSLSRKNAGLERRIEEQDTVIEALRTEVGRLRRLTGEDPGTHTLGQ